MDKAAKFALVEAIEKSADDPAFFLRFFLRHWFPSPLPPFHLGLLALITKKVSWLNDPIYADANDFLINEFKYAADPNDPESLLLPVFRRNSDGRIVMISCDHNNIIVPRGFSKTTLTNGANLYDICTDGHTFCVYISKSADHAEMQLQNIKIELESNELLRAAYGNLVPTRADVEKWQADQLQLTNGAILVARGKGGQVRGLNYRARRPNKIILDDVEDDGLVASTTERLKTENWFYSSVEKAGQVMEGAKGQDFAQAPLQIINLGTLLGSQCLMMTLSRDPKFNTVRFGAKLRYDDVNDTEMLWPYKMSYQLYSKERARHAAIGKLAEFTREIDSAIRIADDTIFPTRFIYEPVLRTDLAHVSIFCDPAISDQPDRDHTALIVAGRRHSDGALWFLEEWGGVGKTPYEMIEQYFHLHRKWQCTKAGFEAQAFQRVLGFMLREEMAKRQYFFVAEPVIRGNKVSKDDRIVGLLSPRYLTGFLRHLRPLPSLEMNLLDWPNGKKDYADAGASALALLGESGGLAIPEDQRDLPEYAPLTEPLSPAFRTVNRYIVNGRGAERKEQRYPVAGR